MLCNVRKALGFQLLTLTINEIVLWGELDV